MVKVKFKKLVEQAKIPSYSHETDAAMDFYSAERVLVNPGETKPIKTGLVWEPEIETHNSFYAELRRTFKLYLKIEGRSGLALKYGVGILGGVIDEDYRGEIIILFNNTSKGNYLVVEAGEKIAQGIVYLVPKTTILVVDDINSNTSRGEKGFGSTGV